MTSMLRSDILLGLCVVVIFVALSYWSKKIDGLGAIGGGVIAFSIFLGGGFPLLFLLFVFFVLGSAASAWKIVEKTTLGFAEKNKGKRTIINAVSNGGVAACCGVLAFSFPSHQLLFSVMSAASLAAATSDTLSSELGNLYGSHYMNILSLKKSKRGLDGVISLEGTVIGLLGSLFMGGCYAIGHAANLYLIVVIVLTGFAGNLVDSVLGASIQRKGWVSNHTVNLLNTISAALLAACFMCYS